MEPPPQSVLRSMRISSLRATSTQSRMAKATPRARRAPFGHARYRRACRQMPRGRRCRYGASARPSDTARSMGGRRLPRQGRRPPPRHQSLGLEHVTHEPARAARGREDAAHKVIAPLDVIEGMERVVGVYPKAVARDKDSARGAQADIAAPGGDGTAPHRRGSVVPRAATILDLSGESQLFRYLRQDCPYSLIAS